LSHQILYVREPHVHGVAVINGHGIQRRKKIVQLSVAWCGVRVVGEKGSDALLDVTAKVEIKEVEVHCVVSNY